LLTTGEDEVLAAVAAGQRGIGRHRRSMPYPPRCPWQQAPFKTCSTKRSTSREPTACRPGARPQTTPRAR
jgi:hypothetical protein